MNKASTHKKHNPFMQEAIKACKRGLKKGQTPFGCCIVQDGQVVIATHNHVWQNTDITAHAEVHAIRLACKKLKTINLENCVLYSTCEPCPMCFSAIHWARIPKIVYGASIKDAQKAGFNELSVSNQRLKTLGGLKTHLISGVLRSECQFLFQSWQNSPKKRAY